MALKKEEISNPGSCLNKAADDEPIFVLRGRDKLAHLVVRNWADVAEAYGVDAEKVKSARDYAEKMALYPGQKLPG